MALFYAHGVPIGYMAIMLAMVASMGGFIFGYDTGQISDILLMSDFKLRFAHCTAAGDASSCEFSRVREGLIVSLLSVGTLIGALLGAPTADFFGRRKAMSLECIVFIAGVIIQVTAFTSWVQIMIGRFISGLGVGGLSAAVPMYQAETAPPEIRGAMTATYQLFITFGILVAYLISFGTRGMHGSGSWRTVVAIGIIWALVLCLGIQFMPESPRWLAGRNRMEEAKTALARTRQVRADDVHTNNLLEREIEGIRESAERDSKIQAGWLACFNPQRKTLYRTLLGMSLQSLQQLTGANYFFYYGATIFQSVGIADSFVTQIILGSVNFGCTFGGLYVMERFGRRRPLIIGGLWQSAWLFVFAGAGTGGDPEHNKVIGTIMIVAACLFILGFATTWAPGIWILIGETFPTRTRAKQGALSTASNWLWNFLIAFFTPFIVSSIGFSYGFVFAGCNLLGAIVVYFFLYESSGLSLEAVDTMYQDTACKPWNSRRWAPEGYLNREEYETKTKEEKNSLSVVTDQSPSGSSNGKDLHT